MNLLSSLLKYTADQIAALRAKDSSQDTTVSGINTRLGTAETKVTNMEAQLATAISAVTVDSEVQNIRVGDDNVTYTSAGIAVRTQFADVKADLSDVQQLALKGKESVAGTKLDMSTMTDVAGNSTVRFSLNRSEAGGYITEIGIKARVPGTYTIYLATQNGVGSLYFHYFDKFDVDCVTGVNTLKNGIDFLYKKYVPVGTIIGVLGVADDNRNIFYKSGETSLNVAKSIAESDSVSGVAQSYGVSINMKISDPNVVGEEIKPKGAVVKSASMSDGSIITCGALASPRFGERIAFTADITSFSGLQICWTKNIDTLSTVSNYITVDNTNLTICYANNSTHSYPHGLTIQNNIQVEILETEEATIKVIVSSNGVRYTAEELYVFSRFAMAKPYAKSVGSSLTNCVLGWSLSQLDKQIWYFGDSYTAFANSRWSFYAKEWIDNILLDGHGGEASDRALTDFRSLLTYGTPKYAVWTLGMNNGNDSNSTTPDSTWLSNTESFISDCLSLGIIPILATIPSSSTHNHEGKNYYVRNSGYRYIDFAKAVGATTSGWYSGMLNPDNTHPTIQGAIALYGQLIADLPEVCVTGI